MKNKVLEGTTIAYSNHEDEEDVTLYLKGKKFNSKQKKALKILNAFFAVIYCTNCIFNIN